MTSARTGPARRISHAPIDTGAPPRFRVIHRATDKVMGVYVDKVVAKKARDLLNRATTPRTYYLKEVMK